jgi:LacI family transcriptional regulator
MGRPTIKDVARVAGVSFKTVSRVINSQPGVSDATRQRVEAAIDALGYVVNHSARLLALGHSRTLGVVIPRLTDPHVFHLVQHLGEETESRGLQVIILTRHVFRDGRGIIKFVGHGIVGGLIFVSPATTPEMIDALERLSVPTVIIETVCVDERDQLCVLPVSCVASDSRQGACEGVEHLLQLGHRRIGYIAGMASSQSRLRLLGGYDALERHGLGRESMVVAKGDWTWDSGFQQAMRLVEHDDPPTAIFCANDNMALGAIRGLAERGMRVPEEVSILGFDDIPAASQNRPALTTIKQPTREMIRRAVDMLEEAMDGQEQAAQNELLPTRLVCRESCMASAGAR